ncbi:MAG: DUF6443 domain-containing protein [Bacteroidales bacterium]|jgi:RHS repeat-associated protein|nr:DUF6443 domain-containing protein [Bacteroidales bacterium]
MKPCNIPQKRSWATGLTVLLMSLHFGYGQTGQNSGANRPAVTVSPSSSRNYIHTIMPQVEVSSIPSGARSPSQYMETVEYLDGLGRSMQTVAVGASPNGKDIVTPIVYDDFGREAQKYLPYEATGGTGAYRADALDRQYDFYKKTNGTSSASVHKNNHPYALTVFESSPLHRVTKQGSPGGDWHPDYGRCVRFWYNTNKANEVPLWKMTPSGASATGSYCAASTLYRQDMVDENNHKSYEYTDLQGKTVRTSRERREGVMTSVTYVYDDFGRPAYVIPDTVKVTSFAETDDVFKRFIYACHYDERGRVREKHVPGAGWTYIVYNKLDQPILTQDADQRLRNEWSYTKYDAHSRIVATGIFKPGLNLSGSIRSTVNNGSYTQWETRNGAGYANTAFPTSNCEEQAVYFYDSYGFTAEANLAYGNGFSAHGLPTGSKVKVPDENTWLYTAIYYDKKGRVAYTAIQQANGKYDKVTTEYDFCDRPVKTTRNHSAEFSLATGTGYDHAGRVKTVKQKMGNDGEVTVAENSYNEIGQLIRTKLHQAAGSATPMETVDYEYNARGWLTWIKSENYRQKLYYNYALLESNLSKNPWNGNVSTIEWNAKGLDNNWHAFECKYDRLDRLESGSYSKSVSQGSSKRLETGYHDENFTYDIMGNIKSLKRKLGNTEIDNLTYAYTNGHRVARISDGSGNSLGFSGASNYTYDEAGRMTNDSQKGTVAYNHLGLVKSVTKGSDVLKYTYDATGRKVKRQFKTETARHYIDGVEYEGSVLKFVATPYGRIRKDASGVWNYDYFLKDHLGNVRVVLAAGPATASQSSSNRVVYMATMEESKAATEGPYFANLDETRADRPYNYPDKNLLNAKLAKVPGKNKGPSILLPVLAGDTISISAKAFYNTDQTLPGKSVDIVPVVGSAIAAMTSPAGTILSETARLTVDLGAEASQSVALINVPQIVDQNGEVKPQSGINFILYNSRMEVVEENTGVLLVEDKINEIQTLASDNLIMQEAGFLEVYINNEAQTPVYYDNFTVAATTSNVIEINAYYPYGMLLPALSLMATPDKWNGYKYSGKELQKEMGLNWGDHENRMADYTVGRWWVPDPLAEKRPWESTYSFCGNSPVNRIDPDGRKWKTTLDEEIAKQLQNAAQEQLKQTNREISRLEKRIDKLEVKGKDVSDLQGNLNTAKYEAGLLDNFDKGIEGIRLDETTNYTFTTVDGPVAELNSRIDGTIVIENVGTFENRVHETVHAVQYFNKEVILKTPGGRNFIYPSKEAIELPAYRTQFLMEKPKAVPAGTPAIPRGHSLYGHPKSLLEINSQWLKRIPNPTTGGRLY